MILINPKIPCNVLQCDSKSVIQSRILAFKLDINDNIVTVINVYGPNDDISEDFLTLQHYIQNMQEGSNIIGGWLQYSTRSIKW